MSLSSVRSGLCLALAVGGLAWIAPPAFAQDTTVQGVTVTAPRRVGRSSSTGAPIEMVNASRTVTYSDLDLRTEVGAAELDKRVASAAMDACKELENRYPIGTPDVFTCAKDARAGAKSQVDAAKAYAIQNVAPPAAVATPAHAPAAGFEPAAPPARRAGERG